MNKFMPVLLILSAFIFANTQAFADTPKTLAGAHGHGVNVTGKIILFRAQQEGLEIGSKENFLDAEVLVSLDTQPGKVFGIRAHDDKQAAAREMIETLRAAYLNEKPVTIQHRRDEGKSNLKIIWVQLGEMPSFAAGN